MASGYGGRDAGPSNRQVVLREILLSGPLSRTEIAARIGLTGGAVSRIVRPLIDAGLVRELPQERAEGPTRPGRRFVLLDIDPRGGQVLGIGIGPSLQTVGLADLKSDIIASAEFELDMIDDPDQVIRRLARESRRLIGTHVHDRSRLLGGLLMVTGNVDPERGDVLGAPYLGWGRYPLRARLADFLDLPMTVRPVTATIASAEKLFGATRGWDNVLTLLCGLGIGASVIVDGRLVRGGSIPSGGIGDMKVTGEHGGTATLDELSSGLGLLRRLHGDAMTPARTPLPVMSRALRDAIQLEQAGDRTISALMARAGRELGHVVVRFAHVVTPEVVMIVGPLSRSPAYLAGAREAIDEGMAPHPIGFVASAVSNQAYGLPASCAMAVCECLLERPLDLQSLGIRSA